jgi:hypothetical protein
MKCPDPGPVVVNVALPSILAELGGGITGLQSVVDGHALVRRAAVGGIAVGSARRAARVLRMPGEESVSAGSYARRATPPPVRRSPLPKE